MNTDSLRHSLAVCCLMQSHDVRDYAIMRELSTARATGFAAFQRSGRDVAELSDIADAQGFSGPGRAYLDDGLFLERIADKYCVTIGSDSRMFGSLKDAERALYDFAASEGYVS